MTKLLFRYTALLVSILVFQEGYSQISIDGPIKVDAGSTQNYTASSTCTNSTSHIYCWDSSHGTLTTFTNCLIEEIEGGGGFGTFVVSQCNKCPSVSMHWANVTTLTTGTLTASDTCGNNITLNVTIVPAFHTTGMSVSPTQQFVTLNANATITLTGTPTGGDGSYYYRWDMSTDSSTWTMNIADTRDYSPPTNIAGKIYYRLRVFSFDYISYFYSTVTVLDPGSISTTTSSTITSGTVPSISAVNATGGNCSGSYTYQWQKSVDNGSTWTSIGGNVASYPGTAITVSTLIRRQVTCGTVTAHTNSVAFTVPFAAGFVTAPGLVSASTSFTITGTPPTGGYAPSGYTYQWEKSTDGINFTEIAGKISQNYTVGTGVTVLTWYRRRDMIGTPYLYTNTTRVKVASTVTLIKPNGVTAPTSTQTAVTIPGYGNLIDTTNINFVRVREFTKPGITDTANANATTGIYDVQQTTVYYDGLGRLLQTVSKQITPSQKDLISFNVYDGFGRMPQQFLSYADNSNTGNFRSNVATQQPSFYDNLYNSKEGFYYTSTSFEFSALNIVDKKYNSGKSWAGNSVGIEQQTKVNTSDEDIKIWYIDASSDSTIPRIAGVYNNGNLVEHITTDENGNQTVVCQDVNGRTILKKQEISDTLQGAHNGWLCTYYVYDYFGNLRFIISPNAVSYISHNSWVITSDVANELCYRYSYDRRKRIVVKKAAGSGEVWLVYDARDRVVMTQDSLLRASGKWNVISYDAENRQIKTTLWNDIHNRTYHQDLAYNSTTYPVLNGSYSTLTEDFYDDYSWKSRSDIAVSGHVFTTKFNNSTELPVIQVTPYPITPASTAETRSLHTGTRIKVMDPSNDSLFTFTVSLYDDHNRLIQKHSSNFTGGWDTVTTKYDFNNKALSICSAHSIVSVNGPIKWNEIVTAMNYDHASRIIETKKYINKSTVPESINRYTYDELSRAKTKMLGKPVETLNFDYTIQNWSSGINKGYADSSASTSHWFGIDISYDYGFNKNELNGNIAGVIWKTQGDDSSKAYGYNYDDANRFLKGDFTQQIGSSYSKGNQLDFDIDSLQYDLNGNILMMQQKGLVVNSSSIIDHLSYTYQQPNGLSNKLAKVTDNSGNIAPLGDFKDSTNTNDDYAYDGNGNLILDNNKHISNISYNILNLPQTVAIKGRGTINYIYDASGNKIRKIVIDSSASGGPKKDTITYTGIYVYDHDTLQLIGHEEGRIRPKLIDPAGGWSTSNIQYVYDYFVKDNLGNVRMVLTEETQTDTYAATMENKNAIVENALFDSVSSTQYPVQAGFEPATGADTSNHYVSRLNASSSVNKRVGPTILLKVMAGDTLSASTYAWYSGAVQQPGTQPSLLNSLGTLLADGVLSIPGSKFVQSQETAITTAAGPALTSFLSAKDAAFTSTAPKAFLNWALLDDRFNYIQGGVTQIPTITAGQSKQVLTASLPTAIPKNGYLYIYVSNESPQDVYFDNVTIQHHRGPLVQEDHYYAFGLQMNGICSKSAGGLENKYKFDAGDEMQNHEFSDGSGFEMYEAANRSYDQQIGRFAQIDQLSEKYNDVSPYQYALDNPITYNDPTGLEKELPKNIPGTDSYVGRDGTMYSGTDVYYGGMLNDMDMTNIFTSDGSPQGGIKGYLALAELTGGTVTITPDLVAAFYAASYSHDGNNIGDFIASNGWKIYPGYNISYVLDGKLYVDATFESGLAAENELNDYAKLFKDDMEHAVSNAVKAENAIDGGLSVYAGFAEHLYGYGVSTGSENLKSAEDFMHTGGTCLFTAQVMISAANVFNSSNDGNFANVAEKGTIDIVMAGIGTFGGPIGWGIATGYYIGDMAGLWGDWGEPGNYKQWSYERP